MIKKIIIFIFVLMLAASCLNKKVMKSSTPPPPPPPPPTVSAESEERSEEKAASYIENKSDKILKSARMEMSPPKSKVKIKHVGKKYSTQTDSKRAEGRIVYNIPDSMTVGKTFEVFARISQSKDTVTITENLTGEVRTSVIAVSEVMEVELIDPGPEGDKNFDLTKNNDGRQIVDEGETYTEWRWDVTPKKSGNKTLKIVVSVIRGSEKKQTVYVDEVIVNSNVKHETKNFFEKYWQWMMTTIVIPFVVWLFKRRKKEE